MNHKLCIKLVGCLIILASLLAACAPREVVKEVEVEVTRVVKEEVVKEVEVEVTRVVKEEVVKEVEVEVTRVVKEEVVKEVEVTRVVKEEVPIQLSLSTLAEQIRAGEIDVGKEYGMSPEQRFHRIHAIAIEMKCTHCMVEAAPLEVALPSIDAPGPVDRRVCVGCHLTGPASTLYVPKE